MRLYKKITVEGQEYPLEKDVVRLNIDRPGVAVFQVLSDAPLKGKVVFALNWNFTDTLITFFTGEVRTSTTVDAKRQRLVCDEFSARLDRVTPIALRHPTLEDVLTEYNRQTGVDFILPPQEYATTKVPSFYAFGSGYHAFANMGQIFSVPEYVWLTQGDGKVFVGSWEDSMWQGKEVAVPEKMLKVIDETTKSMPVSPVIRPGCMVNGQRLQSMIVSGHDMELSFDIDKTAPKVTKGGSDAA